MTRTEAHRRLNAIKQGDPNEPAWGRTTIQTALRATGDLPPAIKRRVAGSSLKLAPDDSTDDLPVIHKHRACGQWERGAGSLLRAATPFDGLLA